MTKNEALRMALEELKHIKDWCLRRTGIGLVDENVLAKVEEALAQPEQEPVAWGMQNDDGQIYDCITPEEHAREEGEYTTPLYTTPPQRKPLTDEQRNWIVATCPTPRHIIDTVEKMHGIKEDT